tara:strand:+ start:932 stop:1318 length:387 start_codon:yes stop_codon:yes gene_type:complete
MKLNHFCNNLLKIFILLILSLTLIKPALTKDNIDQKVKDITLQLRCMTCQNQSIYDSDADFSKDIKKIVKYQIIEGKNEKEIIDFMVQRYGEYIAFRPLINKKNIFLWVFPFALFIISSIFLILRIKK